MAAEISPQEKIDNLQQNITLAMDVYQRCTTWKNGLVTFAAGTGGAIVTGAPVVIAERLNLIELHPQNGDLLGLVALMLAGAGTGYYLANRRAVNRAIDQVAETRQLPRVQVRDIFKKYGLKEFPVELLDPRR